MLAACVLFALLVVALDAKKYTRTWAVHAPGGHENARTIAHHTGMKMLTQVCRCSVSSVYSRMMQIGNLDDHFLLEHVCNDSVPCFTRDEPTHSHTNRLKNHPLVRDAWQQEQLERTRRMAVPDPLWAKQWYLLQDNGKHINIMPVWDAGYTGKGVVVTVVDDGIEHTHTDLSENYDAKASTDLNGNDDDPFPNEADPINT